MKKHNATRNLCLRLAEPDDAAFILELRLDASKSKYLSPVPNDLAAQRQWLIDYKYREQAGAEYYFVIESLAQEPLGVVRLYDFQGESFCWGSWILKPSAPALAAIESALAVYETAFGTLGFTRSHFHVRKGNDKVRDFHLRFGAHIVAKTIWKTASSSIKPLTPARGNAISGFCPSPKAEPDKHPQIPCT